MEIVERERSCCRERGREIEKKGEVEEKENDLGPRRRARASHRVCST